MVVLDDAAEQSDEGELASAIENVIAEKKHAEEHTLAIVLSSCALLVGVVGLMITSSPNNEAEKKDLMTKQVYDQVVKQEEEGGAFLLTHGQETSL